MGYVIRMPQLGMSMEEGTVVEWKAGEGEEVERGAVVVLVESEKTTSEVEAREDGTLGRVLVPEGTTVEPGDPIGILVAPGEDAAEYEEGIDAPAAAAAGDGSASGASVEGGAGPSGDPAGSTDPAGSAADGDVRASPGARELARDEDVDLGGIEGTGPQGVVTEEDVRRAAGGSSGDGTDVRATPGARKLAEERGVDLGGIEGTGPQGVVTEEDVEARAAGGTATRTVTESSPLSGMQRTISDRLGESYREAVHVTLNRTFDAGTLDAAVSAAREAGSDVSMVDLLIKAAGAALEAHPGVNAVFEDGEHRRIAEINVGVAVDVERGLVTPVVPGVGEKSAEEVTAVRRDLTERVRADEFTMDDLEGGTFTVSNLGPFGVDSFDPIINPPEVAILGVGRARPDGSLTLSLSFDHRVVNGADAARFLDTLVGAATDEERLASFLDADVTVGEGRAEETREVSVGSASGYSGSYRVAGREVEFDEPTDMGGTGLAPTPVEHLLGALGSCLSLSLRTMAERDGIEVGRIDCDVDASPTGGPLEAVDLALSVESDADGEAIERAVTKAERACYVERALSGDLDVSVAWSRA